jgi:hypothetical protein
MNAMKDPALVEEAKKLRLDLDPMDWAEVSKIVADMANLPDDLKADVRAAIGD